MPRLLRIKRHGGEAAEKIPTQNAKAIFFVNHFDGDAQHKDLHFYQRAPIIYGLWIRIEFVDGEVKG